MEHATTIKKVEEEALRRAWMDGVQRIIYTTTGAWLAIGIIHDDPDGAHRRVTQTDDTLSYAWPDGTMLYI